MRDHAIRTSLAAVAALAVLTNGTPATTAVPSSSSATGPHRSPPTWGPCPPATQPSHPHQQCADLRVPLDYDRPRGRHITVRLARITAADPARRLGTLVHLAGGPGESGLDWPADLYRDGAPGLRDRYDLVGFDIRGLGQSTPVTCGLTDAGPGPRYPDPDGSIDAMIAYSRRTAASCLRAGGPLIRHLSTANAARDLDRIRAALGERVISLYGISYGTYLGAVYATLFPHRTARVVLDSAVDPRRMWYGFIRLGGRGVAERLPDLTAWVAARDDTYGFGRTSAEVHRRYRNLVGTLDAAPFEHSGARIDGNVLRHLTLDALKAAQERRFPQIAATWAYLASTTRGDTPAATTQAPPTPVPPGDNRVALETAVHCNDATWPRRTRFYADAVRADRRRHPDDAGRSATIRPCAFWPAPSEPPVRITGQGPRNILVVQNLRDPSTPWIAGLGMHDAFLGRAALLTVEAGGHGVVGHNACATGIVLRYLTQDGGNVPLPPERRCPAGGNAE
ncbi:alpha/beta fold hydrolase [Streptosporangium sp. NPDC050855]|uniref:alpha/beta fold hydrolase n=1 Tax=Streptosporangium sp. NPDC050855 TaxID=3366194 RepID=UPI0037901514